MRRNEFRVCLCLGRIDLGKLALQVMTQLRKMTSSAAPESLQFLLRTPYLLPYALQLMLGLLLRLTQNELCLSISLRTDLAPQLLCAHESLVERLVTIAERLELFVKIACLCLKVLVRPRESFKLLGYLLTKLLDPRPVVSAQSVPEIVPPRVKRSQVKSLEVLVSHQ